MIEAEDNPDPEATSEFVGSGDAHSAIAVRRAAMDLLARREHSRFELQRKLLRRYPRELVLTAIARLADEDLQSDARFAESYVRQRGERGYGPLRIRRELQERCVDDSIAEAALQASGFDWHEVARRALSKKFGNVAQVTAMHERARMLRFAAYRGFTRDQLPRDLD